MTSVFPVDFFPPAHSQTFSDKEYHGDISHYYQLIDTRIKKLITCYSIPE